MFFALFRVIQGLGRPDPKYLSHSSRMYQDIVAAHGHLNAFGMDLSQNAFSHHASVWAALPYWILVLVMAGTGYLQSAQMMSRNPTAAQNPQMRLMKYLPLLFVVFFIRFPAGVLLYYAMSNVCRIVQQDAMYRFDPKVKALVNQEVQEVEAHTHEIDEQDASRPARGPRRPAAQTPAQSERPPRTVKARAGSTSPSASPASPRQRRAQPQPEPAASATCSPRPPHSSKARPRARRSPPAVHASSASTSKAPSGSERDRHRRPNGNTSTGPATNGKPPGASQRTGSRDRKPPPKGGHRTNRKRRGR